MLFSCSFPFPRSVYLLLMLSLITGCETNHETGMDDVLLKDMVRIPAGEFIMGSNDVDTEMFQQRFGLTDVPYQDEHPERTVSLAEYYIDQYEVTNSQYKAFLDDVTVFFPPEVVPLLTPGAWVQSTYPEGAENLPVEGVSWYNADMYCNWRGKRLPSEAEWEKAARGTDGIIFPWGNKFDVKKANAMSRSDGVAPVGTYPGDVSPYGVYDMAGNVFEWVDDWYRIYPGNKHQNENYGEKFKTIRGWSWGGIGHYVMEMFYRSSYRTYQLPDEQLDATGLRCAYSFFVKAVPK